MGIPTLIKTLTASGSSSLDFVDGTSSVVFDSTYDEYMFVFIDIHPSAGSAELLFQVNATDDAGGDYDTSLITSTVFFTSHEESGTNTEFGIKAGYDLAQSASFQKLNENVGGEDDESGAGILHIFNPSSTTFIKHFYATFHSHRGDNRADTTFTAGYVNDTTAIDEIRFKPSTGNIETGVIQMYGIA